MRHLRQQRHVSLRALAARITYDFGYLGQVERGERSGSADLAKRCDDALEANGALFSAFASDDKRRSANLLLSHVPGAQPTTAHTESGPLPTPLITLAPTLNLGGDDVQRRGFLIRSALALGAALAWPSGSLPDAGTDARFISVTGPAGRMFAGSAVPAMLVPAIDGDRIMIDTPAQSMGSYFLHRPEHALVVGEVTDAAQPLLYAVDTRYIRRRLGQTGKPARFGIPRAYVLDELTLGIIWAIANLDDALLSDDALLGDAQEQLATLGKLERSSAGRDLLGDLSPVSQAWVGSLFCAEHITRHSSALSDVPLFWTCERRGEEASGWLFFSHKYEYLKASTRTQEQMTRQGEMTRLFCIPPEYVAMSGTPERTILLLTAALMESFGIRIAVCTDPAYMSMEGFVSDGRNAIVANWVDTDSLWHVDVTDHRPTLTEYSDAAGYASAHSVIAGSNPLERLRSLAHYLELDWPALTRRCAELGRYGLSGLAAPRSRLLSVLGAERSCQFIGNLPDH